MAYRRLVYEIHKLSASYRHSKINYLVLLNSLCMQKIKILFFITIIFCLFIFPANGQHPIKNYEKEWKKVEGFAKKNLPKSALIEVKKIYVLAKKEGQDAQLIKAVVYMIGLQQE